MPEKLSDNDHGKKQAGALTIKQAAFFLPARFRA
jgi:hypothetical protein